MRTVTAAAAVAAALALAAPAAPAAAGPRPGDPDVKITDVTLRGTGCSKSDTSIVMSNGNKVMDIVHSGFVVRAGAVPAADGTTTWVPHARRDCRISMKLTFRSGWTFAVTSSLTRGHAQLSAGAKARHASSTAVDHLAEPLEDTRHLVGPMSDVYALQPAIEKPVYGPCGQARTWTATNTVDVYSGGTPSADLDEVSLDWTGGAGKFGLDWRTC
ncbi:DUF4360 domain-containing protein [Pilimelia terevasa]|nr:DUF4360 domain-containing protein [Pilimelia terevasa]